MDSNPTLDELPGLLAAELIQITPALASTSRAIICGILDDAIGRALAAEAEIARLQARVAELESQLAAQQWRPGNETPPAG